METFSALLAICAGNSPVPVNSPHKGQRLSKQPWGWWFETPSWSLWRQCNVMFDCGILLLQTILVTCLQTPLLSSVHHYVCLVTLAPRATNWPCALTSTTGIHYPSASQGMSKSYSNATDIRKKSCFIPKTLLSTPMLFAWYGPMAIWCKFRRLSWTRRMKWLSCIFERPCDLWGPMAPTCHSLGQLRINPRDYFTWVTRNTDRRGKS